MKTRIMAAALAAASLSAEADELSSERDSQQSADVAAELPTVTIEASRLDQTAMELPANVQIITRAEIAASGARDAVDLLEKRVPALHVSSMGGSNPALKQLSIGGYGENGFGRLLVLVDGERLNNPDMNAPNLAQLALGSIRQIEIISGSQSVLHGDGASAGMINIITDPEDDDYALHGRAEVHGGSWGTIGGSLALRGGVESEGLHYWGNGGWDHSAGYRHNSEYDIYTAGGGIKKSWENGSFLRVSSFYSDADYGLPGALSREEWQHSPTRSNQPKDDFYRRTTYGLNTTLKAVVDEANTFKLIGTASRRAMDSRTTSYYYGMAYPWNIQYDMYSYELTPEWINTDSWFGLENELIVGMTYRYDRNHARSGDGSWTKYAIQRQDAGFFAQDTLHLTDEVALQLGGRYQRSWLDGSKYVYGADTRNCNLHAYDAALLVNPIEDLKLFARFSRHFRTPFIDENSGAILSPETGFTVDAGADWTFLEDFNFGGNVYHSRLKHEIFYNTWYDSMWFFWDGKNINSPDDTIREGLNLHFAWERDKVAGLVLAYSYVNAEFDGGEHDKKTVPMVAKSTANLTGRVWLWDDCFVFGGYRYVSEQYSCSDFANNLARIPAYGIFHLGVQYEPAYELVKGWKLGFTVDNLFDKNYCDYATYGENYYPAAGRSYMFSVSYEF